MYRISVEFYFGGWEEAVIPKDFTEFQDYFSNFSESCKVPTWLVEMAQVLVKYKNTADIRTGSYRKLYYIFSRVIWVWC